MLFFSRPLFSIFDGSIFPRLVIFSHQLEFLSFWWKPRLVKELGVVREVD